MILFIDDQRNHPNPDYTARTADAAIAGLRLLEEFGPTAPRFREVWFDHDLGVDSDIWDVVRYLETRANEGRPIDIGTCVVHSMNPVGADRLMAALERAGYHVIRARVAVA